MSIVPATAPQWGVNHMLAASSSSFHSHALLIYSSLLSFYLSPSLLHTFFSSRITSTCPFLMSNTTLATYPLLVCVPPLLLSYCDWEILTLFMHISQVYTLCFSVCSASSFLLPYVNNKPYVDLCFVWLMCSIGCVFYLMATFTRAHIYVSRSVLCRLGVDHIPWILDWIGIEGIWRLCHHLGLFLCFGSCSWAVFVMYGVHLVAVVAI